MEKNEIKNATQLYEYIENKSIDKAINTLDRLNKQEQLIDLHTHTIYSDGDLDPNELIKLAINKNIGSIAITDHDTLKGVQNINYSLFKDTINVIPGIELSAKVPKGQMHILGLNIDIYNEKLNNRLNELRSINLYSVLAILLQIRKDYNISFTYEEIQELINAKRNIGRPDIAKLCVKNGYATSVKDAFNKYLIDAFNKTRTHSKGLPYSECLELITNSGGIPVLAHPKSLELSDKEFLYLLKDMINCGLKGIEVYHSTHTKEESLRFLEIANELNLLVSGGSDFHGISVKPDVELGTGVNNNIKIKQLSVLNEITKKSCK